MIKQIANIIVTLTLTNILSYGEPEDPDMLGTAARLPVALPLALAFDLGCAAGSASTGGGATTLPSPAPWPTTPTAELGIEGRVEPEDPAMPCASCLNRS